MGDSTHTLEGVSSLTVRQGDITLFVDVENFTIVARDNTERYDFGWGEKYITEDTTYAIRETKVVLNDEGIAFKVVKAGKPVTRTASIEIDEWTVEQINAAQKVCGAPEKAIPTWVRDSGKQYVEFKWEDSV